MVMLCSGGLVGWGQLRCSGRLTGQLDILRLMTRGFLACSALGEWFSEDLSDRVLVCGRDREGGKVPAGFGCCGRAARRLRMNDNRWGTRSAWSAASCI